MLLSELEERERRFKLALRAGIPVLLLVFLVFYALFVQEGTFKPTLLNISLIAAIIFITVYFNYFLIDLSVKESLVDQTTQSYNQKAFIAKLRAYKPNTMVLLVIKNLSVINENYGTEKVDLLLYTIIHRLNTELTRYGLHRPLIARRFGAEFVIAFNNTQMDNEIKKFFEDFIVKNKVIDNMEIDYAFAMITETQKNIEHTLSSLNDLIIRQSNKSKHNKADKIHPIQNAKEIEKLETDVIDALKKKQFRLTFRPLLNTHTNTIDIYEIVAKMVSSDQQEILPRVYLPIINRLGLGVEYDYALSEHIIGLLPLVDDKISFTFNLSPFSLRNNSFQKNFFTLIGQESIEAHRLIIQLYERKTHHDLSGYFETLTIFRQRGIRICIDNFGSSNASMEYMKHFRFDMVQFDREYVTRLHEKNTHAMLRSLLEMTKTLQIQTVAKWVDKEEQKRELISLGIDYLQGFGIGKPLTEKQLIDKYN
jgi:EAL domain-containing protein (putative c-di-GMP-specific phosphodiesterase class I)/GGDEF domain-containing protein